jgi:hypothetical protein
MDNVTGRGTREPAAEASVRELTRQLQMLGCWDTARAVLDDLNAAAQAWQEPDAEAEAEP